MTEYQAEPPSELATHHAQAVLEALHGVGLSPDSMGPSGDGGMGLAFVGPGYYADIECFNDGEIYASHRKRGEDPTIWQVDPADLTSTLEKITQFLTIRRAVI